MHPLISDILFCSLKFQTFQVVTLSTMSTNQERLELLRGELPEPPKPQGLYVPAGKCDCDLLPVDRLMATYCSFIVKDCVDTSALHELLRVRVLHCLHVHVRATHTHMQPQ